MLSKSPTSFFCMWISCFSRTLCWRDCPFSIELSWHPLWNLLTVNVNFLSILWSMNKYLSTCSFPFWMVFFPHYLYSLIFFSHNCFVVINFFNLFCLFYLGWPITPSRSLWIKHILPHFLPASLIPMVWHLISEFSSWTILSLSIPVFIF